MFNIKNRWMLFWLRRGGLTGGGRLATWMATWFVPPYKGRAPLARLCPQGYISPWAEIQHADLRTGNNIFIGDRVMIYKTRDGGYVEIRDGVALYGDSVIETVDNGNVIIGEETHIQSRCHMAAAKASIIIGKRVEIAPNCSFFPYNHETVPGQRIREQPLVSRGDIVIGDDAWLGVGVIVLDGVHIGEGAVIGAGAVVTRDIPANAIATGMPATVVKMRGEGGP
jgi:acetyltransferase-like isoleucine patch superfamily enzyme